MKNLECIFYIGIHEKQNVNQDPEEWICLCKVGMRLGCLISGNLMNWEYAIIYFLLYYILCALLISFLFYDTQIITIDGGFLL